MKLSYFQFKSRPKTICVCVYVEEVFDLLALIGRSHTIVKGLDEYHQISSRSQTEELFIITNTLAARQQ